MLVEGKLILMTDVMTDPQDFSRCHPALNDLGSGLKATRVSFRLLCVPVGRAIKIIPPSPLPLLSLAPPTRQLARLDRFDIEGLKMILFRVNVR